VRAHESERYVPVSRSVAALDCASKRKVNELRSGSADEQYLCLCACVTAQCAPPYAASARDSCAARSHYDARCYALLYSSAAQCWDELCELILAARYSQREIYSFQPTCELRLIGLSLPIGLSVSIYALPKLSLLQHGFEFR
jgi:hypothetical protein